MPLILVVEDVALARDAVARLLETEGFQTERAANGKEAYAKLYSNKPDLVLLDLMMPELDGITLLRMIRQHPQWETIPIIVLTALPDENRLVARARELGVKEIVSKTTFGFEELMQRIRKTMGNRLASEN